MKNDNTNVKSRSRVSRVIVVAFAVMLVMAMSIVPAFAAEFDEHDGGRHFDCQVGDTFQSYQSSKPVYLYVDQETPITIRLLKEHPEYYVKIRDTDTGSSSSLNFKLYLSQTPNASEMIAIGFDSEPIDVQYDNLVNLATAKGINVDDYLDYYVSVVSGSSSQTTYKVVEVGEIVIPPAPPNPIEKLEQLLEAVPKIVTMIFAVASSVMSWIWSEPLVLIPVIFAFVMTAIAVCRRFVKR